MMNHVQVDVFSNERYLIQRGLYVHFSRLRFKSRQTTICPIPRLALDRGRLIIRVKRIFMRLFTAFNISHRVKRIQPASVCCRQSPHTVEVK